jgi:hypothetical protein
VLFNYGGGGTHPLVLLDVVIFIIGLSYSRQESSFLKNLEKIPMANLNLMKESVRTEFEEYLILCGEGINPS